MKKLIQVALGLFLIAPAAITANAQSSAKSVTLVVPFTAGGQADTVGRIVATNLADALKQNVVVENVPGAGGIIGARKVMEAAPDGLTLFLGSPSQLVLAGLVNRDVKVKSDDFTPIHIVGASPYVIMARGDLAVRNGDELAALARESAKKGMPLTYASVGVGTLNHLLGEDLSSRIGAPLIHVPYKGGAEVMRDLVGARVDLFINIYTAQQIALAQEGRFKFIAALSPARQPLLPQVPSVDEGTALKGFHTEIWSGVFVRKDTPAPLVANLTKAMAGVIADEKVRNSLLVQTGLRAGTPHPSPADVAKDYAIGVEQFRKLAKTAGFQ